MEKLYTCENVAERYSVKIDTVYRWIRQGKLKAFRIGRIYRIYESDLADFEKKSRISA